MAGPTPGFSPRVLVGGASKHRLCGFSRYRGRRSSREKNCISLTNYGRFITAPRFRRTRSVCNANTLRPCAIPCQTRTKLRPGSGAGIRRRGDAPIPWLRGPLYALGDRQTAAARKTNFMLRNPTHFLSTFNNSFTSSMKVEGSPAQGGRPWPLHQRIIRTRIPPCSRRLFRPSDGKPHNYECSQDARGTLGGIIFVLLLC